MLINCNRTLYILTSVIWINVRSSWSTRLATRLSLIAPRPETRAKLSALYTSSRFGVVNKKKIACHDKSGRISLGDGATYRCRSGADSAEIGRARVGGSPRNTSTVNLRVFPRGARWVRTRVREYGPNYARIHIVMLARAARIKRSDSSRMLTSSSACSRGNQPARDAKTCCGSSKRRVSASAPYHRVGIVASIRQRSRCRKFLARRRRGAITRDDRRPRAPKGLGGKPALVRAPTPRHPLSSDFVL